MNVMSALRVVLARTDFENDRGAKLTLPGERDRLDAQFVASRNALSCLLETAGAIGAGTPVGSVAGIALICVGAAELSRAGVGAILGPWIGSRPEAVRYALAGAKHIGAGAAAFVPVVGTIVNAPLALKDAADAVNAATLR